MSSSSRSLGALRRADHVKRIVQLRQQGRSYRGIAEELGLAVATVHGHMQRAMARLPAPDAELHRREGLDRLDAAIDGLWPSVATGDPKAVYAMVQVEARRASLLGLDMPAEPRSPSRTWRRAAGCSSWPRSRR